MSRETKIGLFTVLAIVVAIWGFKFLKGQNLLSRSNNFVVIYNDVDNLPISSPVLISGLQVGVVKDMYINPKNPQQIAVILDVSKSVKVPKDAIALLQTTSFLGNKAISLSYKGICTDNCAVSGDTLASRAAGLLESMLPEETLAKYFTLIKDNVGGVVDSINAHIQTEGSNGTIDEIKTTISNLRKITDQLNGLLAASSGNIQRIAKNLDATTSNLAQNNQQISALIANAARVTDELASIDFQKLAGAAGTSMDNLNGTLVTLQEVGHSLNETLRILNQGEGTAAQLLKDPGLYNNLERMTMNLDFLLQDLRLNPKRYVNVSVFGKKQKQYELPEDDPAFRKPAKDSSNNQ
jgi:phospholipid/cholesterol/gamma-HCH transport system substrate-binding protein